VDAATYAFPGARVTVEYGADGFELWLDEVLSPAFTRGAVEPDAVVVRVALTGEGSPPPVGRPLGPVTCFVFDGEIVRHEAWDTDHGIVVEDAKYGTRYVVTPDRVDVEVLDGDVAMRSALLRVVRELAVAQSLFDPARVLFHTSAIRHGTQAVLFSGAKEAGKTTLAARLAALDHGAVLANDCTLVEPGPTPGTWRAHAVPLPVSVRPETVARLPALFTRIPALPRPSRLTLREADDALALYGPVSAPTRLRLSPPQFARALGAELAADGALAVLAFVRVDENIPDYAIEVLDAEETASRLHAAVYGRRGTPETTTVFEQQLGRQRPSDADTRAAERVARDVRGVDLRVGPGVLERDDVARALRDDLVCDA
jgi:hypothetical protein